MNILITGAKGFVGKNLTEALKNIRDKKDRTDRGFTVDKLFLYDIDSTAEELCRYTAEADFVFHLAGVNRPKTESEFIEGNAGFTDAVLSALRRADNACPVMLASSIQAQRDNPYGISKLAGERLLREHSQATGAKALIYRFPNLFGKWCRPNYNSVVATFCHNIANDLPIVVNDKATVLTLAYIDDVVEELLRALTGNETHDGDFCAVPTVHTVTLGDIEELLRTFSEWQNTLLVPNIPEGSFAKKLFSAFVSYLPPEKARFAYKMNTDHRGSFTELLKFDGGGQVSVNVSKPGITKGQHWHNTKWELFIVVAGHGLIEMRKIGSDEVLRFEVTGERIEAVYMLPGYTHNIINLSDTEDLVTVMWANEKFSPERPDTFFEEV